MGHTGRCTSSALSSTGTHAHSRSSSFAPTKLPGSFYACRKKPGNGSMHSRLVREMPSSEAESAGLAASKSMSLEEIRATLSAELT